MFFLIIRCSYSALFHYILHHLRSRPKFNETFCLFHFPGHDIVATFMVQKPLSLLQDDLPQLEGYIFDEIRVPTTKACSVSHTYTES